MPIINQLADKCPQVTKIPRSKRNRSHRRINDEQISTISSAGINGLVEQNNGDKSETRTASKIIELACVSRHSTSKSDESSNIHIDRSDGTSNGHKSHKSLIGPNNLKEINSIGRTSLMLSIKTLPQKKEYYTSRKKRITVFGCPCSCSPCSCYLLALASIFLAIAVAAVLLALLTKTRTSTITSTVTTSTTTTTKAPVFNVNMLVNGGGETGPCATDGNVTSPTGWTTNGDMTQLAYNNTIIYTRVNGVPVPTDRGDCFFYGNSEPNTTMWQTVNVTHYADSSLIDTHTVRFNLSAWLGGYSEQNDKPSVLLTFYDQNNQLFGTTGRLGPLTNIQRSNDTLFLFQQTTGFVPIGARFMTVLFMTERDIGGYNDGYVDNISVFLYI